jgi:hypothetical protein
MIHQNDDAQAEIVPDEDTLRRTADRALTQGQAKDFGLIAPAALGKNFGLDTNVLLHDSRAMASLPASPSLKLFVSRRAIASSRSTLDKSALSMPFSIPTSPS